MTASEVPGLEPVLEASRPLTERFHASGHRLFLVGGVVRDHLAGRPDPAADLDCTTDARPAEIKAVVGPIAEAMWTQGERFGTIGCVVAGRSYEITTHRAESYDPGSRKPTVVFGDRIADDLARRDFTVNAMAVDLADGRLVDPHLGRSDLVSRTLRTPLDPSVSFTDDPLRMLRAARFVAGHGLTPVPELVRSVMVLGDRLAIVSVERVRDELEKLLLLAEPAPGLAFLAEVGLWERILPEPPATEVDVLGRLVGAVMARAAERWAALFVGRESVARERLAALRPSKSLLAEVDNLLSALEGFGPPATIAAELLRRRVHDPRPPGHDLDRELAFARAVRRGLGEPTDALDRFEHALHELRRHEDIESLSPPFDGEAVMAGLELEPGPEVGRALELAWDLVFERGPLSAAEAWPLLRARWGAAAGAETRGDR